MSICIQHHYYHVSSFLLILAMTVTCVIGNLIIKAMDLFGTPDYVWADLQKQRANAQAIDYFYIILGYTHQSPHLRVHLRSGCLFYRNDPRYTIHGTTGSFVKFGLDPQEEALRSGRIPNKANWVFEPESNWGKVHSITETGLETSGTVKSLPGDYRLFYENVRDAIHGKAACTVTPIQASRVIRIIELALESAEKGSNIRVTFKED
jgi:scyllo-inositol 2-dehydrogenase (NADP+)